MTTPPETLPQLANRLDRVDQKLGEVLVELNGLGQTQAAWLDEIKNEINDLVVIARRRARGTARTLR